MPSNINISNFVQNLSPNTTVSGGLDADDWGICAYSCPPMAQTRILWFNRNVGVKNHHTYVFTTTIGFGAAVITLTVSLTGTATSSNFWLEATVSSDGSTQSTPQIKTVQTTSPIYFTMATHDGNTLNFALIVKRFLNGSFDDVTVTLQPSSDGVNGVAIVAQKQAQSNWCWAAVGATIAAFYDPATLWTQCRIVNNALGQTTCCTDGSSDACNKTGQLDNALTIVGNFDALVSSAMTMGDVVAEIDDLQPIGAAVLWAVGGHGVIISGYDVNNDSLNIRDPISGSTDDLPYNTFRNSYLGRGRWVESYKTKA
ncbi:MAG: papain-like cysteine protease family protein [Bryobacteraceae bacterium]